MARERRVESSRREQEWQNYMTNKQKCQYVCKYCGRKEIIHAKRDRVLCSHCRHWIYKTPELEFKYVMQETMIKKRREQNE